MRHITSKVTLHCVILAGSLALTFAVRASLNTRYAAERYRIESEARAQRTGQIAAEWNKLSFTDVWSAGFTERFLSLTNWNSLALDDRKRQHLRERLPELLAYLCEPSLSRYLGLKTNGLHAGFELTAGARESLSRAKMKLPVNGSAPEQVIDELWRLLVIGTNATASPSRITSICLEHVKVALTHTNSPNVVFDGPVRQGFALLQEPINPGFYYGTESKRNSGAVAEPELFVLVSFFARSSASTNASPVYLSLYWSAAEGQWALDRLFTDRLLNFKLFF